MFDLMTGTTLAEQGWAMVAAIGGGHLIEDPEYCDVTIECFAEAPAFSSGTTFGHTVTFRRSSPSEALRAHETQHVFDIENVGALAFYARYVTEAGWRWITREGDPYRDLAAERRAYCVMDYYDFGVRPLRNGAPLPET